MSLPLDYLTTLVLTEMVTLVAVIEMFAPIDKIEGGSCDRGGSCVLKLSAICNQLQLR